MAGPIRPPLTTYSLVTPLNMAKELYFKFYFILINNFKILHSIANKSVKCIRETWVWEPTF